MTNVAALVRAWLVADSALNALIGERVATVLDPADGFPAVVIGAVNGAPRATPTAGVDAVQDWTIALYCYGGLLGGGKSDLPDTQLAWSVAQTISDAVATISGTRFESEHGQIVAARVVSASPTAVDPDTRSARATVTVALQIWS